MSDQPPGPEVDGGPGRAFTELNSVQFADLARQLLVEAARNRISTRINFRAPPKDPSQSRALTRNGDGSVTVSVTIRGRNGHAVAADMIDGIMSAARISGRGDGFSALWEVAASVCDPLLDR